LNLTVNYSPVVPDQLVIKFGKRLDMGQTLGLLKTTFRVIDLSLSSRGEERFKHCYYCTVILTETDCVKGPTQWHATDCVKGPTQ